MLTTFNGDVDIQRALKAGACGYMLKSTPRKELIEAIRKVHSGKKNIPPEVAANLAEHMSGEALTDRMLRNSIAQSCVCARYRLRSVATPIWIASSSAFASTGFVRNSIAP